MRPPGGTSEDRLFFVFTRHDPLIRLACLAGRSRWSGQECTHSIGNERRRQMSSSPNELLEDIPPEYRERFIEIVALTDSFCDQHLNAEYKEVCRRLSGSMCQENSPVLKGKAASWACGIPSSTWCNRSLPRRHPVPDTKVAGRGPSSGSGGRNPPRRSQRPWRQRGVVPAGPRSEWNRAVLGPTCYRVASNTGWQIGDVHTASRSRQSARRVKINNRFPARGMKAIA